MSGPELVLDTPRVFLPLLEPARYKGAHGGRGSGKSHFFGESVIERSAPIPRYDATARIGRPVLSARATRSHPRSRR
jgi:hypothetical protein